MKIKIITDRRPFVDGRKTEIGDIVEVSDDVAAAMIQNEFAQPLEAQKPAAKKKAGKPKKDG